MHRARSTFTAFGWFELSTRVGDERVPEREALQFCFGLVGWCRVVLRIPRVLSLSIAWVVGCGRIGYEELTFEQAPTHHAGQPGSASSDGALQPDASVFGSGDGQTGKVDLVGDGGSSTENAQTATSNDQASATSDSSVALLDGTNLVTIGGTHSGGAEAQPTMPSSATVSDSNSSYGSLEISLPTSSESSQAPSSAGSAGATGSSPSGTDSVVTSDTGADTAIGFVEGFFWFSTANSAGADWSSSTLVFTRVTTDSYGVLQLDGYIDWFGTQVYEGRETVTGTYDPKTQLLVLDEIPSSGSGPSAAIDHYEATYDVNADTLVNGSWATGTPGTFEAYRVLNGTLVTGTTATASEVFTQAYSPDKLVDSDIYYYWTPRQNNVLGQWVEVDLAAPAVLSGLRVQSYLFGAGYTVPTELVITYSDGSGAVASQAFPVDPGGLWNPIVFSSTVPVTRVHLDISQVSDASARWLVLNEIQLFQQ